ncbi:D-alanyl-D-alanine carboxypeptidase family protein [Agromyces sp. CFH 90414]|uniref:D-alanyl-D-alanine carboxypeptidase family protein n=2 Tax=Agromyces agglutinans TaxID=2662258 RepID=A0A6I2FFC1_9MICO|nr:D-alanyl-D-alanine carboxypeptidase family protein [Agromyces agglutinans]
MADEEAAALSRRRLAVALPVIGVLIAIAALVVGFVTGASPGGGSAGADGASASNPPRPAPTAAAPPAVVETFDRAAHSLDDPASIWVVVNKLRPIVPDDYEPADLVDVPVAHTWEPLMRHEASDAAVAMFDTAANEAGLFLASNSAYRSYWAQDEVYDGDDETTARPGYSEHQTGLVMDIGAESGECSLAECFGETPEGAWLRDNAYRFGFILRYPADKRDVTGYTYEPWHFRYVGVDLATEMRETGFTTLEEFFGLPAAPDYE